jgi:hypothetical protein
MIPTLKLNWPHQIRQATSAAACLRFPFGGGFGVSFCLGLGREWRCSFQLSLPNKKVTMKTKRKSHWKRPSTICHSHARLVACTCGVSHGKGTSATVT